MKNWILKHRFGALYLWCGAGAAVTITVEILLILQRRNISIPGLCVPFVLWVLAGALLLNHIILRPAKQVMEDLNALCDPEPMLHWAEGELAYYNRARWAAKKSRNYLTVCIMDQAAALYALGRFHEAQALHQSLDLQTMRPRVQLVYYANAIAFHTSLEQLPQAEAALEQVQDLLAKEKKQVLSIQDTLTVNRLSLAIAKGETQGVEAQLLPLLDRATTEYSRVTRHDLLAQLYLQEKRFAEARVHLDYVVAHGNKLHLRTQAVELLASFPTF